MRTLNSNISLNIVRQLIESDNRELLTSASQINQVTANIIE